MFGKGPGFAAIPRRDADDREDASFTVDFLQLQVRIIPGNVVLKPLIEENIGRTQFLLHRLGNRAHEFALFPGKGERHRNFSGSWRRDMQAVCRVRLEATSGS